MPTYPIWGLDATSKAGMPTTLTDNLSSLKTGFILNGQVGTAGPIVAASHAAGHLMCNRRLQGPSVAMGWEGYVLASDSDFPFEIPLYKGWELPYSHKIDVYVLLSTELTNDYEETIRIWTPYGGGVWTDKQVITRTEDDKLRNAIWYVFRDIEWGDDDRHIGVADDGLKIEIDATGEYGDVYVWTANIFIHSRTSITQV